MHFARPVLLALALASTTRIAGAGEPVRMRIAEHDGFGRITLVLPKRIDFSQTREGDRVTLRFSAPLNLRSPTSLPRNVKGVTSSAGEAVLTLSQGASLRPSWRGHKLLLDV